MSYSEKELIKQLAKNPNIKTAEDAKKVIFEYIECFYNSIKTTFSS